MGVIVREATRDDRSGVIDLWRDAGLTRPWNDPLADFDLAFGGPSSTIYVAADADDIVGTVMVGFDGHRGWIYYLASHSARRRQGIARQLMAAAEAWLRDRGAPKVQLMVRADNALAAGFYEAIGYETQDVLTIGRRLD